MRRWSTIGGTAVWLCSDYGAATTGEVVHVDGGYHILGFPQPEQGRPSADAARTKPGSG
jgi:enoyl-[acyl-carrier-protein] reductase (NADH)